MKTLGMEGISRSQVSRMPQALDEMVASFRNRHLDSGPYTYLWLDALTQRVREGGRVVNVSCVIAIAVNAEGHREVLGVDLITTEDGARWTAFLRGLVARRLSGASLVISDAHPGLKDATAACLPGATWQRCRTPPRPQPALQGPQGLPRTSWPPACAPSSPSPTKGAYMLSTLRWWSNSPPASRRRRRCSRKRERIS